MEIHTISTETKNRYIVEMDRLFEQILLEYQMVQYTQLDRQGTPILMCLIIRSGKEFYIHEGSAFRPTGSPMSAILAAFLEGFPKEFATFHWANKVVGYRDRSSALLDPFIEAAIASYRSSPDRLIEERGKGFGWLQQSAHGPS